MESLKMCTIAVKHNIQLQLGFVDKYYPLLPRARSLRQNNYATIPSRVKLSSTLSSRSTPDLSLQWLNEHAPEVLRSSLFRQLSILPHVVILHS